jgi:hypothetical protein
MGGATFVKDYELLPVGEVTAAQLNADFALGNKTATFSAARSASAPATVWYKVAGICTGFPVTTANTGRISDCYYDATGQHDLKGLMIEAAGTNLIPKSNTIDDATWTETNTVSANADAGSSSPDGTATAPSLTASAANGTLILTTAVTAQTYSVWLKRKTGTGTIQISGDGTNFTTVTVTSSWRRFSDTRASASQKCGIKIVTDTDAVYVWGNQYEASPYATSFIPTTTAALTRGRESSVIYVASGNRTAVTETVILKFAPFFTFSTTLATDAYLHNVQVNSGARSCRKVSSGNNFIRNVYGATSYNSSITPVLNTSYVYAITYEGENASPNSICYFNGSADTSLDTNYTAPTFIANFSVGGNWDGTLPINGIIQSVAIYNRALSAGEVSTVTNTMNE